MSENKKTARTFQCRDTLWERFEQMARELECSVDYLINDAMKQYARQRGYGASANATSASVAGQPPAAGGPAAGAGLSAALGAAPGPAGTAAGSTTSGSGLHNAITGAPPPPSGAPAPGSSAASATASGGASFAPPPPPPAAVAARRGAFPAPPAPNARRSTGPAVPPPPPPPPARSMAAPPPPARLSGGPGAPPPPPGRAPSRVAPPPARLPGQVAPPPLAQSHAAAPQLSVYYQGERFVVNKERYIIGRGRQSSDLTIKDPNVSRQHAMIELVNGQYYIVDLGSTNGVEFAGQRIQRRVVNDGDIFRVCDHELRFTLG